MAFVRCRFVGTGMELMFATASCNNCCCLCNDSTPSSSKSLGVGSARSSMKMICSCLKLLIEDSVTPTSESTSSTKTRLFGGSLNSSMMNSESCFCSDASGDFGLFFWWYGQVALACTTVQLLPTTLCGIPCCTHCHVCRRHHKGLALDSCSESTHICELAGA